MLPFALNLVNSICHSNILITSLKDKRTSQWSSDMEYTVQLFKTFVLGYISPSDRH